MHHRSPMRRPVHFVAAVVAALALLAGCTVNHTTGDRLPVTSSATLAPDVTLPAAPDDLAGENAVERLVRDAQALTGESRFKEARRLLNKLRSAQARHGAAWRAAICAEMILALREGNMAAFRSLGQTLEPAWADDPHRVDDRCIEVVALHRGLVGRALPLDTPPALGRVVQRATLRSPPKPIPEMHCRYVVDPYLPDTPAPPRQSRYRKCTAGWSTPPKPIPPDSRLPLLPKAHDYVPKMYVPDVSPGTGVWRR